MFRPMLSASLPCMKNGVATDEGVLKDLRKLDWSRGFIASPKIDGIRAIKHPTLGLVSRTLKPIPNKYIQEVFASKEYDWMDGELVVGSWEDNTPYNTNQSAIMSEGGEPNIRFCVFDHIENPGLTFTERLRRLGKSSGNIEVLPQELISDPELLLSYEESMLVKGLEGIIIRDPHSIYKYNRSTFKQQGMIKLKRFVDAEAKIVGFIELMRNQNEATLDSLGYTRRSYKLEGRVSGGTLGTLVVVGVGEEFNGIEFEIGSGFDVSMRDEIWNNQELYKGRVVKYKYQPHGAKDRPRAPIFLGFRPEGT